MRIITILFSIRDHHYFLHRVLKSIENQTFKSHSVILVYSHFVNLCNHEEELEKLLKSIYTFPLYCIRSYSSNGEKDRTIISRINEILQEEEKTKEKIIVNFFNDSSEMSQDRLEFIEKEFKRYEEETSHQIEILTHNIIEIVNYNQVYNFNQPFSDTDIFKRKLEYCAISRDFWDKLWQSLIRSNVVFNIPQIKQHIQQTKEEEKVEERCISNNLSVIHSYDNSAAEIILHTICEKKRILAENLTSYIECEKIYSDWMSDKITLNSILTMKLMYEFFIAAWYVNRDICIELTQKMNELLTRDDVQVEFLKHIDHYTNNFDYTIHLLNNTNRKKICVHKDISLEEQEKLCNEGHVYKYVKKEKNFLSGNYLCTANPVIRSKERFKEMTYDVTIEDQIDPNYLSRKVLFVVIGSFNVPIYRDLVKFRKLLFKKYGLKNYFLFDGPQPDDYIADEEDIFIEKTKVPSHISKLMTVPNPQINPHMTLKFLKFINKMNFDNYDFVVRLNLSTYVNFEKFNNRLYHLNKTKTLAGHTMGTHLEIPFYTPTMVSGTCMVFSIDCIEYLKLFDENNPLVYMHNDDVVLSHISRHYISSFTHLDMLFIEDNLHLHNTNILNHFLIRIKNSDRNKDVEMWKYLMKNIDRIDV